MQAGCESRPEMVCACAWLVARRWGRRPTHGPLCAVCCRGRVSVRMGSAGACGSVPCIIRVSAPLMGRSWGLSSSSSSSSSSSGVCCSVLLGDKAEDLARDPLLRLSSTSNWPKRRVGKGWRWLGCWPCWLRWCGSWNRARWKLLSPASRCLALAVGEPSLTRRRHSRPGSRQRAQALSQFQACPGAWVLALSPQRVSAVLRNSGPISSSPFPTAQVFCQQRLS